MMMMMMMMMLNDSEWAAGTFIWLSIHARVQWKGVHVLRTNYIDHLTNDGLWISVRRLAHYIPIASYYVLSP